MTSLKRFFQSIVRRTLALALALSAPIAVRAAEIGKTFATPEEAVRRSGRRQRERLQRPPRHLRPRGGGICKTRIGCRPPTNSMRSPPPSTSTSGSCMSRIPNACSKWATNFWPFPVPLVKQDGRWFFDTEAGKEEILNRRIGKNELPPSSRCAPTSRPSANTPARIAMATRC